MIKTLASRRHAPTGRTIAAPARSRGDQASRHAALPRLSVGGKHFLATPLGAALGLILISGGASADGGIYGGFAHEILVTADNDQSGNSSATGSTISTSADLRETEAHADGYTLSVTGSGSTLIDVYGGQALVRAQAGDATGGTGAIASVNASAFTEVSKVSANGNAATIDGQGGGTLENVYGGQASITAQAGKGTAGNQTASNFASAYEFTLAYTYNSEVKADDNRVTIKGGASVGSVYGGSAFVLARALDATAGSANATSTSGIAYAHANNYVEVTGTLVSANRNQIIIDDGVAVRGEIYGGQASIAAYTGTAIAGTASTPTANSSTVATADANAWAEGVQAEANHNTVDLRTGVSVAGNIYGGSASLAVRAGVAQGGTVTPASSPSSVGAQAEADAAESQISASGNTVLLNGHVQGGSIYGGHVNFYVEQGSASVSASGQAIGATAQNPVYLNGSEAYATNNVVAIGDQARVTGSGASLYGGFLAYNTTAGYKPQRYDVFTGNTLNFSAQPISVHAVANFEKYNFTLQPSLANTQTALISARNIVLGTNDGNVDASQTAKASTVTVVGIHAGKPLSAGDRFVLMRANSLTGSGSGSTASGVAQQGISLLYDVRTNVNPGDGEVTADILACQATASDTCPAGGGTGGGGTGGGTGGGGTAARTNPQLKSLSEAYLAGTMLVTRGADIVAGAFDAVAAQSSGPGLSPFALASASHNRYDSGSHIDSNDRFFSAGLGYRQEQTIVGAFIEGGWGNYDSHNSFYNAASVDGNGDTRYYGAGLLGRYAFTNGFYADASFRFGKSRVHFDTDDLQNLASGEFARYSLHTRYTSGHLGVGYQLPLNASQTLDLSAKYLGTSVGGKRVTVAGDPIHFERVDSRRLRLNAELAHRYDPAVTLKAGLGYEREFDGKAKATAYDSYRIDAPDVKGGTALFSLGAQITPTASRNLTLDLAAIGYAGKRDGYGAFMSLQYRFQ